MRACVRAHMCRCLKVLLYNSRKVIFFFFFFLVKAVCILCMLMFSSRFSGRPSVGLIFVQICFLYFKFAGISVCACRCEHALFCVEFCIRHVEISIHAFIHSFTFFWTERHPLMCGMETGEEEK